MKNPEQIANLMKKDKRFTPKERLERVQIKRIIQGLIKNNRIAEVVEVAEAEVSLKFYL